MKTYDLTIQANKRPETLERLLRVIRHRGFEVIALQTQTENDTISLKIKVQSERAIGLLFNQLAKLPDVVSLGEK
ncbi:acetolactate synthase 2 small subunit [Ursidibacter maritimus]|uniref:Acetolactate synthase 2 small subunit n=1 Tax=Ursidibacter maritimus TaxID=1331689 RepID=A0A949T3S5_9PAST|nr:acetolactate synthase 2 small subunit [Ursidibacter maritimus]KAE9538720.1 acetolactate synthase [Ursidibacter maritimus]MBV6523340.1 acetolactate synthase 2 small subunit [Ursidibacter maritimus]MBV6525959.1 acetolactate synthase 2 small subunit [Ursidibacter maritimus]MBV6527746.1 acetolactate synthase 2 small subunit [Ursidibacter maritimus]MBV6529497.1 acetolactate synthase 2 small subunit [Ursidibacter maritimus]